MIALAESGSTLRAAATLHLTQSAISRALLSVEDRLGVALFNRTPRGLTPTAAGLRLVAGAGGALAHLCQLEQDARSGPAGRLPLRVVCECYTAYRWLPSTLAKLRLTMAELEVTLAFEHTAAPVAALLAHEVDVALLTTGKAGANLVEERLFSDEIVFVVAANHALAARAGLGPEDLRRYPLITSTHTPEPEVRWFYASVFGRGAPRVEHLRFPLTEAIIDAARAGLGIAVLSEWIALPYLGGGDLVAKRWARRRLNRAWRIAYRRDSAAGARQLANALAGAPPRLFAG